MSIAEIRTRIARMSADPRPNQEGILGLCSLIADEAARAGPRAARVVATANITQSGLQTVDGVALNDGDTCFCSAQTNPAQNGPFTVRAGVWERAPGMDRHYLLEGNMPIRIAEGAANGGSTWNLGARPTAAAPLIPGRDPMPFTRQSSHVLEKLPCRVASTANIDLATGGLLTIDGIPLAASERVLAKDQADPAQNGIRIVAPGAWARASDMNESSEAEPGTKTFVFAGTQVGPWVLEAVPPIVIGTTPLIWRRYDHTLIRPAQSMGIMGAFFGAFTTAGGAAEDVMLIPPTALPLRARLIDCALRISTAATGAAFQLRDGLAGSGNLLFTGMAGTPVGWRVDDASTTLVMLVPGTPIVLRRTDTGAGVCAGTALVRMIEG